MSKKKKFAGKKTKLAEHALTQVLEQERSEAAETPPSPSSASTLAQAVQALRNDQLHLDLPPADSHTIPSQDQLELADSYLTLLQELEDMRELLRAPDLPARQRPGGTKPWTLPSPEIMKYSLQVINHRLREIRALMG
jgi:hypothetical protein